MTDDELEAYYTAYESIEDEFLAVLDESLGARGPEMLYDVVDGLGLHPGAVALDVGCGQGRQAIELADRFGVVVIGIDPVRSHIEEAESRRAARPSRVAGQVRFELGRAEALSVAGNCIDFVWCKDVLVHVIDLEAVYREFLRVLRPGGRALVYQSCYATERLEPNEAEVLWGVGIVRQNTDPARTDAAIAASGLRVDDCIEVGLEWGEHGQEHSGKAGRRLLHAARLLREPERYKQRFGEAAYDIMLGDCLWHVYRLLGKMSERVYVLRRP